MRWIFLCLPGHEHLHIRHFAFSERIRGKLCPGKFLFLLVAKGIWMSADHTSKPIVRGRVEENVRFRLARDCAATAATLGKSESIGETEH